MSNSTRLSSKTLEQSAYSAALAVFRLIFGFMLLGGVVRFWLKGWIEELYILPKHYFHYYGFEWVPHLGNGTYLLFLICGLSALCFALGLFYRLSSVLLFLSFTYIELLDKTNYLNHYYFVTLVLLMMIWLPANTNLALDNIIKPTTQKRWVPAWTIWSIRLILSIVYFYAGLAKLNSDWLLEAMPLRLWLPAKNDLPIFGSLLNEVWVAYIFSWFGAFYDLTVPFFLLYRPTRPYAFIAVIIFHGATSILFPIGLFPYIMILSAVIFFDDKDIDVFVLKCKNYFTILPVASGNDMFTFAPKLRYLRLYAFAVFFVIQVLFPWRYLLYPGELFWTEEGYRFSWRVMLMEKTGYAQFVVKDAETGNTIGVNNNDFLTRNQEKMMSTQPDFLLQYAKILYIHYQEMGIKDPEVFATVYVGMNGRRSRLFIDSSINLAKERDLFRHKTWIIDYKDKIYGL